MLFHYEEYSQFKYRQYSKWLCLHFLFVNIQWNIVGLGIDCIFLPTSQSQSQTQSEAIWNFIQPKEEKRHTINMEQIKKATQHVPASKMNKEVYEPASALDVSYFMIFLVVRGVTLVVALGILPQTFGRWWRSMNGAFAILWMKVEWWRHSNPTCCNQICLNLTHSQAVGILKHPLVPEPPCEILTTYFLLFFISSYMKGRSYYVFLCSQWIIGGWLLSLSFLVAR